MKLRVPPTEKNFPDIKTPPKVETNWWDQISYIAISLAESLRILLLHLIRHESTRKDSHRP